MPDITVQKGQFTTDHIDDFVTKGDKVRKKREESAAKSPPKETPKAPKFISASTHAKSNFLPKTDKVNPGAAPADFLGSDLLSRDPIEEGPTKLRAGSADRRGRGRPAIASGNPYLQQQVMKGPSPRQAADGKGSKQFL